MADSMKLGGGGRFAKMKASIGKEKGVRDAGAIAFSAGAKKYGKAKMESMAQAGKKKH